MSHEAPKEGYPLTWPIGVPRTTNRHASSFKVTDLSRNLEFVGNELRRLGASNVVLSCSVPRRQDGWPLANASEPRDPGVAAYFDRSVATGKTADGRTQYSRRSFVIACDRFTKVASNMRGLAATVEALRAIERYGSSTMVEQAFSGFAQLPPGPPAAAPLKSWWQVLEVDARATVEQIQAAYLRLAREHHPDLGGDAATMAIINAARTAGLEARRG